MAAASASASFINHYQELSIDFDEEKTSFTYDPRPLQQVIFKFCCEPCFTDWVVPYGSTLAHVRERTTLPLMETFVLVSSLDDEKAREILGKELQGWPALPEKRQELIDVALNKAREVVKCMRPHQYNSVHLNFRVKVYHYRFSNENHAIVDEVCNCMVPAAESSIESLEKKKLTADCGGANCCVCLEEIVCGGEAMLMPCRHGFHGDCIKKWLRTSHYCPVCRFEMPTRE